QLSSTPSDVKMFQSEAQSAARLKHPGIVQVHDANFEEGIYYFVMEFVAGYTVGDWLRRSSSLPEKDALLIADAVADALQYAWGNGGIIHCDIKPDNIIIDSDGTVKVADLGLARTINTMAAQSDSYTMSSGTPPFMPPEQITGERDIDCRSDIYSLGATIYHLVTGKMLFAGNPPDEIMNMQLTSSAPDPLDVTPDVSAELSWMIEKMLAKDKTHRHSDWGAVRVDIQRVMEGILPVAALPDNAASTTRRSARRTKIAYRRAERTQKQKTKRKWPIAATAGMVAIALIGFLVWKSSKKRPGQIGPAPIESAAGELVEAVSQGPAETDHKPPAEGNPREMYEFARNWVVKNPGKYEEAIAQFKTVVEQTKGTEYSLMAQDDIRRLTGQANIEKVLKHLAQQAAPFAERKDFVKAAQVYETYSGNLASETETRRMWVAAKLRERHGQAERKKERAIRGQRELEERAIRTQRELVEKRMAEVVDAVVSKLIAGNVGDALAVVGLAMEDKKLAGNEDKLIAIKKLLGDVEGIDKRILDSFAAQKGKRITIRLTGGTRTAVVVDVKGNTVICRQQTRTRGGGVVSSSLRFGIKDLAPAEKFRRMGSDDRPDVALIKGLTAFRFGDHVLARRYFAKTEPVLAYVLVPMAGGTIKKPPEDVAEKPEDKPGQEPASEQKKKPTDTLKTTLPDTPKITLPDRPKEEQGDKKTANIEQFL
ncbi:serine/threonine protein kinase, partial [Verrucomicrobiota bacterium]